MQHKSTPIKRFLQVLTSQRPDLALQDHDGRDTFGGLLVSAAIFQALLMGGALLYTLVVGWPIAMVMGSLASLTSMVISVVLVGYAARWAVRRKAKALAAAPSQDLINAAVAILARIEVHSPGMRAETKWGRNKEGTETLDVRVEKPGTGDGFELKLVLKEGARTVFGDRGAVLAHLTRRGECWKDANGKRTQAPAAALGRETVETLRKKGVLEFGEIREVVRFERRPAQPRAQRVVDGTDTIEMDLEGDDQVATVEAESVFAAWERMLAFATAHLPVLFMAWVLLQQGMDGKMGGVVLVMGYLFTWFLSIHTIWPAGRMVPGTQPQRDVEAVSLRLDGRRLQVGAQEIDLEQPFGVTFYRRPKRNEVVVELRDKTTPSKRLRLVVPVMPDEQALANLAVLEVDAPSVPARVWQERLWPTIEAMAQTHGTQLDGGFAAPQEAFTLPEDMADTTPSKAHQTQSAKATASR